MAGRVLVSSFVLIAAASTAGSAFAQAESEQLTLTQAALVCGPPADAPPPSAGALRVIGAQDTVAHSMYSQRDLLVIGGGTNAGVQLGQQFFVRRGIRFGLPLGTMPTRSSTVAWIRIVAVNETTAIAAVHHVCDSIHQYDYLDPFVMPTVAAEPGRAETPQPPGELDFTALARVLNGTENREHGGAGDLMLMDRGSDHGIAQGARFAVYRDLRAPGLPLAAIGEAIVMTTGPTTSVVRLTQTRDAVRAGDYLVPRR